MNVNKKTAVVATLVIGCCLLSLTSAGCSGNTWRITCDQLRALRIGMSTGEVEKIVGPPASQVSEDGSRRQVRRQVDLAWFYQTDRVLDTIRAVRLRLEFTKGKLAYATSYRRNWYDDRENQIFLLNEDGSLHEGREFSRWFCP